MSDPSPGPTRPQESAARKTFWEQAHHGKDVDAVSWWQSVPSLSLDLVDRTGISPGDAVIDVGAGWSTLTDHLIARGFTDVSAVDLSTTALATIRERFGAAGSRVVLKVADILDLDMGRTYALWHDRAVFHFLTEPDERDDYRASLRRHVAAGDWAVVATFGPDGPTTCSGLPIVRYTHAELAKEFPDFELVDTAGDDHETPWGVVQQFTAVLLRRHE